MNQDEIFRKLTRGLKFDRVRYREDAENLGIVPKAPPRVKEPNNPKNTIYVTDTDDEKNEKFEMLDTFESLSTHVKRNITQVLHWQKPTRIQMGAIPVLLAGRNCVATAQTGSGKTGAFLIPVIERISKMPGAGVKAIVLAPSRELAEQIGTVGRALTRGMWIKVSDTSQSEKSIANATILCATPNKIISMCESKTIELKKCAILILDECDKMLEILDKQNPDDLRSFAAQVNVIKDQCMAKMQMGLFSATMCGTVEKFGRENFEESGVTIAIGREGNSVADTVTQKVIYCGNERGKLMALRQFISDGFRPPAILFTETKDRCQRIMGELLYDGVNAMSLCAAKTASDRAKVIQATRHGKVWLLITTDVAARGLDLPATTTVINYDCPNSVTDYVHRVGRCGRMNRRGHAMTLITQGDKDRIRILRGVMLQSGAVLPKSVLDLAKPDLNDKKRVKKQKVEREELETKVPKRELKATETKRKRKLMAEKKRRDKLKKAKILNVSDNTEWEVAE